VTRQPFRFSYDITTDLAHTLAAARHECWTDAQLVTLDWVISSFADQAHDLDDRFDVERFHTQARYQIGRADLAHTTQED